MYKVTITITIKPEYLKELMFLMMRGWRFWENHMDSGETEGESVVAEKVYGKDWRKLNDN